VQDKHSEFGIAATPTQSLQDILSRRESLHALIDPMGLGNFGVLIQGKRLNETQTLLKGLMTAP